MEARNQTTRIGHSADVRIHLFLNGQILPIEQLGPNFFVLRTPIDHAAADATIAMTIDGDERRWPVRLVNGIQAGQRKTTITRAQYSQSE